MHMIHFDIWQNQYSIVKLNKIKLKKKEKWKKKEMHMIFVYRFFFYNFTECISSHIFAEVFSVFYI